MAMEVRQTKEEVGLEHRGWRVRTGHHHASPTFHLPRTQSPAAQTRAVTHQGRGQGQGPVLGPGLGLGPREGPRIQARQVQPSAVNMSFSVAGLSGIYAR